MQKKSLLILAVTLVSFGLAMISCEKDKDNDPGINHSGAEWIIDSVNWNVVDQDLSGTGGQTVHLGTSYNAGSFYFQDNGEGSFDYDVSTYHREGVFTFMINSDNITINHIEQVISINFSQKIIAYSGTMDAAKMQFEGTETEQTTSSQFVLTGEFYLTKK